MFKEPGVDVVAGEYLLAVNGVDVVPPDNLYRHFEATSGKIVEIHPRLEVGEIIHRDDLLFKIDPRDYMAARDSARAKVRQWESSIARLKKQVEESLALLEKLLGHGIVEALVALTVTANGVPAGVHAIPAPASAPTCTCTCAATP